MLGMVADVVRRVKKALPPPKVKSLDEVIDLFRSEGVVYVKAKTAFYQKFPFGRYKIVIDYIGYRKGAPVSRQEVLKVCKKISNRHLVEEMKKLYPAVRERVKMLESKLGITVKIA